MIRIAHGLSPEDFAQTPVSYSVANSNSPLQLDLLMCRGIIDAAIDQGGCIETSRPTTHAEPTYVVDDVVHYCVTNMPGAVPRTSTFALTNATLPFVKSLANLGWREALARDPHLANGLNVHAGHVNHEAVARDLGYTYVPAADALKA